MANFKVTVPAQDLVVAVEQLGHTLMALERLQLQVSEMALEAGGRGKSVAPIDQSKRAPKRETHKSPRRTMAAVARIVAEAAGKLGSSGSIFTAWQIAKATGIAHGVVHRHLFNMMTDGYLAQPEGSKKTAFVLRDGALLLGAAQEHTVAPAERGTAKYYDEGVDFYLSPRKGTAT